MTELPPHILGVRVDATSYADATRKIIAWSREEKPRRVCVANVHMVVEATASPEFMDVVNGADLVTPDGMPLVWLLRRRVGQGQQRVYGPDLTLALCAALAEQKIPVGFYGGSPDALQALTTNLHRKFPDLMIRYAYSPPFRPLTATEERAVIDDINASGVRVLFVGLGCPKQERWMARHQDEMQVVMVGVGAAFDFHAGTVRQAPSWVQNMGMEWLFRLVMEPRRLWKRYLITNSKFIWMLMVGPRRR